MEVTPDELESLIAEAPIRDPTFQPKRRNWAETRSDDERRARIAAAAIAAYLDRCACAGRSGQPCRRTGRRGNKWDLFPFMHERP